MSVTGAVRRNARARDLALAALPPVAALAVWTLPAATRRSLRFDAAAPTATTAYAAHFVHLDAGHLTINLVGYALLVCTWYAMAAATGRQTRFAVTLSATVLALPVALSTARVALGSGVGYGLSGLVTGVLALLGLETYAYAAATLGLPLDRGNAVVVFGLEVALIAVAAGVGRLGLAVGAVAAALAVAVGLLLARTAVRVGVDRERVTRPGALELGAIAVTLLVGFPFVAFPADPTAGGGVIDLYTHLLGFAVTFVAGYALPPLDDDPALGEDAGGSEDAGAATARERTKRVGRTTSDADEDVPAELRRDGEEKR